MSNKILAGSFLSSFLQAKQFKELREEQEQEKKARLKLFELQLQREQRAADESQKQSEARSSFFQEAQRSLLPASGIVSESLPGTGVELGDVAATARAPTSLTELLADPQMALRALQAGIPLPQAQEVPTEIQILRDPALRAEKAKLNQASAARTFLTNDMRQESAESQAVGKGFGELFLTTQKAGLDSEVKLSRFARMNQLLEGTRTGKLTPAITEIQALGESLGIKLGGVVGPKQALEALGREVALQLRNPAGGAGMPGQLSDKDREFLESMTPGLSKTLEGNKLIIDTAIKMAKRDREVAKRARDYRVKHGAIDEGFFMELAAFSEANPLFTLEDGAKAGGGNVVDFSELPE